MIFDQSSLQTAMAEASLPGFKKEIVSRSSRSEIQENKATNSNSHSNQNVSLQVQQWVMFIVNSKISVNWLVLL